MACACGKNKKRFTVILKGGIKITKPTESAALAFAAKHPGAVVQKS